MEIHTHTCHLLYQHRQTDFPVIEMSYSFTVQFENHQPPVTTEMWLVNFYLSLTLNSHI